MLDVKDKIRTVVDNLCELRTIADREGYDTSAIVDLSKSEDKDINRLKRDLNYSVGILADDLSNEVNQILEGKTSFYIPRSLDEIVGKIIAQNNITIDRNEKHRQIENILDRMFRLPIDADLDNLHHHKSQTYRRTSDINPNISTLVKALMIEPLFEAGKESENKDTSGTDTSQWGQDYKPEAEKANHLDEDENSIENDPQDEYERIISASPDISIPYLFDQLKTSNNKMDQINSMHILSNMDLAYDSKLEQILIKIAIEEGSKILESPKKKCGILFYALTALAEFKQLSHNPELETLLKQLLLIKKFKPNDFKDEIHFNILKIFSKIQYGNIPLEQGTKAMLLEKVADAKNYSSLNFYAVKTLANNTKSITKQDTSCLLEAMEQTETNKLITTLLIKIGQTRDDLRESILKGAWSKINFVIDNIKILDVEVETNYNPLRYQTIFSCLDIIKELSFDRTEVDKFIKSKDLNKCHKDELKILMLVLGLYEGLTSKYNLSRDTKVDNLVRPMKTLVDDQGLFDDELVVKWYELVNHFQGLIQKLETEEIDEELQENILNSLTPFIYNIELINELKNSALNSSNDDYSRKIIDFLGSIACNISDSLKCEANDIDIDPGPGNDTATKLILGDPSKEIKFQALDAILEIMTKSRSAEIKTHVNDLIDFLGPEAYEQVTQISNETSSKQKAQLAELIMLNSRYLRSIPLTSSAV